MENLVPGDEEHRPVIQYLFFSLRLQGQKQIVDQLFKNRVLCQIPSYYWSRYLKKQIRLPIALERMITYCSNKNYFEL